MSETERTTQSSNFAGHRPDDAAFYARRIVDGTEPARSGRPVALQRPEPRSLGIAGADAAAPAPVATSVAVVTPVPAPTPPPVQQPIFRATPFAAPTPAVAPAPVVTTPVAASYPAAPISVPPAPIAKPVAAPTPLPVQPRSFQPSPSGQVQDMMFRQAPEQKKPAQLQATPVESLVTSPAPRQATQPVTAALSATRDEEKKAKKGIVSKMKARGFIRYGFAATGAMVILALTGYVSLETWMTTSVVKDVAAETRGADTSSLVMGEGEDEAEVTKSAVDSYVVAPDMPRVLTIDKINVRSRVLPMSVNTDGSMQAPVNIFDTGWYGASAKPGQKGAAVIDGHASGTTREGIFAYLDKLAEGDTITIERGDAQKLTYKVVFTEKVHLDDVDMKRFMKTYGGAEQGVNIITCTGKWLPEKKTYDHRVMVYTERVY